MIFPRLSVIEEVLGQPAGLPVSACAVLRNVTIEGIESYLRYAARSSGMDLRMDWGDYDNILQEASGSGSGVVTDDTQMVLVCLWLPAFSDILGFGFASHGEQQIAEELERVRAYCGATLRALRQRSSAAILWLGFEPPAWPAYGILDHGGQTSQFNQFSQRQAIASLNGFLEQELASAGKAWLVDSGQCLERIGAHQFYDWRYWHMAHAPFSRAALAELAGETSKHLRALSGKVRKCLVLDCDNTLWGGIIGEDGIEGIRIGVEHPGSAYREFQLEILNLYHRGVILGLCSKNNLDDVLEVLRARPGMVLREEHFSVMRVNWQDKAANLREIATELNIGLDSLVFADDSEFEINLIRSALPEVETILINPKQPYDSRLALAGCGWFDTHSLTLEDRSRGKMYRAEVARQSLRTQSTDLGDYLQSLEMRVTVEEADAANPAELERAAQLCQRTNQFNLSTKRYTREELAAFAAVPSNTLSMLKLSDRFGDYGVVGFCLTILDGDGDGNGGEALIDTFLLSCRALGRGVETAFLAKCLDAAVRKGAARFKGLYIPSKKNAQVANFYAKHGFQPLIDSPIDGDGQSWFGLTWRPDCIIVPKHFSIAEHLAV